MYFLLGTAFILLIVFVILKIGDQPVDKFNKIRYENSYNHVITGKYIDYSALGSKFIQTKEGYTFPAPTCVYEFVQAGDSVSKKENTYHVDFYRDGKLYNTYFYNEQDQKIPLDTNQANCMFWLIRHPN